MNTVLRGAANAKLNLTLDVLGLRDDGYHNLNMVMQEISLCDFLTLTLGTGDGIQVLTDSGEIPADATNLAAKAALLFLEETDLDVGGLTMELQKNIPVCAGMAGGSSDGAAVLRLLDAHFGHPVSQSTLFRLAELTGSDVPFCLLGGTALAEEKGQRLTPLPPLPPCDIVLCKPDFPISTPALFQAVDGAEIEARPHAAAMIDALARGDLQGVAAQVRNVFEPLVGRDHPEIGDIRAVMLERGALAAAMTGSGPTVFGIFPPGGGRAACDALKNRFSETFLAQPV